MKLYVLGLCLSLIVVNAPISHANGDVSKVELEVDKGIIVAETFKVYGNCEMCEKKIESAALSLKGVKKAEWDAESKVIEVIFNNGKVSLDQIKLKIAEAGYDTMKFKSTDATYQKLSGCCKYERSK